MSTERSSMEERLNQLEERCRTAEGGHQVAIRRFRILAGLAFLLIVGALLLSQGKHPAIAQSTNGLEHRVTPMQGEAAKTAFAGWFGTKHDYRDVVPRAPRPRRSA